MQKKKKKKKEKEGNFFDLKLAGSGVSQETVLSPLLFLNFD